MTEPNTEITPHFENKGIVYEEKPAQAWNFDEWKLVYPEGVPETDPKQKEKADLMRQARQKAMDVGEIDKPKMPIYIIGPDGEIISEKDYQNLSAGERRRYMVGRTCDHYEHDVPGLSDWH